MALIDKSNKYFDKNYIVLGRKHLDKELMTNCCDIVLEEQAKEIFNKVDDWLNKWVSHLNLQQLSEYLELKNKYIENI